MKRIEVCNVSVHENYNHEMVMAREEDKCVFHLFKVKLSDESVEFVLADNEEGAISLASCRKSVGIEQQKTLSRDAYAIRIPFKIRGWSYRYF